MGEVRKTGATSSDLPSMEAQISTYQLTQYLMEIYLTLKQCSNKCKVFCSDSNTKCHSLFETYIQQNHNILILNFKNPSKEI